jgi:hypothetical protein
MHIVFILLAALLGLVLPDMAWASETLKPTVGNTWDLYVFGNGRVIFDVLNSIKMLMVPTAGSSGFQMLLLCMASLGFLVLAVAAGFDPGKNLMRMFTYILVVWGVSWGSTSLTANLNVNDLVVNEEGLKETYTVDGVPALVALPAALTSQVGYYFSRVMETYFTMPGDYKIAGGSGGQFNLFAKMVQESNEYVFTDSGVKQTMMAYVTDCVVPAIARDKFQATVVDPLTGTSQVVKGANALTQSPNLMATLATAKHNAIMTKVFPSNYSSTGASGPTGSTPTGSSASVLSGFGEIKTCAAAYDDMKVMMEANAQALLAAGSAAYAKSGVMVPLETLYSSMLAGASAPGGAGSTYSRPSGYILQQGMLNSMGGAFRQAALQTGNNELMQAAAIAQAEQNQRSTWVSGFHIFNNMMGYVFTVLQAFIFAITPMVVVALMVPGLGKSIFQNYAQILIWLTLWMPMLSLINFIITLFGSETVGSALSMSGGVSMANRGILSERTNNLVIAAQFLGTMTPLLTWGLVKGAMAFTEFISHGVGSAFASQAGSTAASGNLSLNNMSMDNTSMNKFNTAMSSTVGTQGTNAFTNAGAMLTGQDMGGGSAMKSGSGVDAKSAASSSLSKSIQESQAVSSVISDSMSKASSIEEAYQIAKSSGNSQANQLAAARIKSTAEAVSRGEGAGKDMSVDERKQYAEAASRMEALGSSTSVGGKASVKGGVEVLGMGGGVEASTGYNRDARSGQDHSRQGNTANGAGTAQKTDNKVGASSTAGDQRSATITNQAGTSASADQTARHGMSASEQHVMQDALNAQNSITKSLSSAKSTVDNFGVANDMDMQTVNQNIAQMDNLRNDLAGSAAQLDEKASALTSQLTGHRADTQSRIDGVHGKVAAADKTLGPHGGAPAGFAETTKAAENRTTDIKTELKTRTDAIHTEAGAVGKEADARVAAADFGPNGSSITDGMTDTTMKKKGAGPVENFNNNGPKRHPHAR